jgi:hypothetical protein
VNSVNDVQQFLYAQKFVNGMLPRLLKDTNSETRMLKHLTVESLCLIKSHFLVQNLGVLHLI